MALKTPKALARFVDEGGTTFHCEDGDWDLNIGVLMDEAPKGALVIAENGCGDFLFMKSKDGKVSDAVFVYWHEENRTEKFAKNIEALINRAPRKEPEPEPPARKPITLQQLKRALEKKSDDVLAGAEAMRRFKAGSFGVEALPLLQECLRRDDGLVVNEAIECIGKLGPAAKGEDGFKLEALLFAVGSKVWEYSLTANFYSTALEALRKIEADEDLIVDYVETNAGHESEDDLIASLEALKEIGSKEAKHLMKRLAAFWAHDLNLRYKKQVQKLLAGS
jgi:hypothetical protein